MNTVTLRISLPRLLTLSAGLLLIKAVSISSLVISAPPGLSANPSQSSPGGAALNSSLEAVAAPPWDVKSSNTTNLRSIGEAYRCKPDTLGIGLSAASCDQAVASIGFQRTERKTWGPRGSVGLHYDYAMPQRWVSRTFL